MRVACKMQLKKGYEAEYKRRHDAIWPELKELLSKAGISDYTIFLDPETLSLFAVRSADNSDANFASPTESISTASTAAFLAPSIATVATGIPDGI